MAGVLSLSLSRVLAGWLDILFLVDWGVSKVRGK